MIIVHIFVAFIIIITMIIVIGVVNSYRRENGHNCIFCHQPWIGRGCGCIERSYPKMERSTNPNFLKLPLKKKIYKRMRFSQSKMLAEKGVEKKILWKIKRDSYLRILLDIRDSK